MNLYLVNGNFRFQRKVVECKISQRSFYLGQNPFYLFFFEDYRGCYFAEILLIDFGLLQVERMLTFVWKNVEIYFAFTLKW